VPAGTARTVLYLHGGGFVTGSPRTFRGLAAALSWATGAVVHLVDYRLAPEHPYPAALDDTLAAYRALLATGIPADRVVLAGDSAGGNLALSAALRLRDQGEPLPAGLVLISPWLDLALTGRSVTEQARADPELRASWLRACARAYLGGDLAAAPDTSPDTSPLGADPTGLPPLHVVAGTDEVLVSDADRLAERAAAAGVPVTYQRWPGMWHDFPVFTGLLAAADEAVEGIGATVRGWWAARPERPERRPAEAGGAAEPSVVVVGAGFGGIGMAIELTRRGRRDVTVLERADRIGGVWRDNTYPGAACDIPSVQYCFSYQQRPDWPRRYSGRADIADYLDGCVRQYGLADRIRLGTDVRSADFDDAAGRWTLRTADGGELTADVLVFACGQLGRPARPDLPGLDRFAGRVFHSARWDHGYDLAGRRVAVIGTGSSALQFVPEIAGSVGHLTVFQRTAGWVLPKLDGPYTARQHARYRRRPAALAAARRRWDLFEEFLTAGITRHRSLLAPLRLVSLAMLRLQVRDPAVRRRLTPQIEFGCKRVGFSNDWYRTFNRSTVDLVTESIVSVTETGVRTADGRLHEVDAIILGTGFHSTEFLAPIEVSGSAGRNLAAQWRDGARAYLGITVPGFPNMFLLYGPNTNLGSGSIVHMLECQTRYVADAVELIGTGVSPLDVRPDVAEAYDRETQRRLARTAWVSCQNWYRTASGRVTNNWPGGLREYRRRTARVEPADYRMAAAPLSGLAPEAAPPR
jgi:cation diffusion facilitator CzcD-associated flavoprotein CzcO/acetyl esterase/lipase